MSIEQLPSGKRRVRYFDVHGKKRSKTFTLLRDAQSFERDIVRAKQLGKLDSLDADLQTLSDLMTEHFASRGHVAARTNATDLDVWASNVDRRVKGGQDHDLIAEMSLRSITPKVVEEWRDRKLREGKGRSSVKKAMLVMQAAFKRAMRDEKVSRNPVELVPRPKPAPAAVVPRLSPRQVELIRSHMDDESALLVSVLAYSGLRPSEALALSWGDIGTNTIRVERALDADGSFKATKTNKHRSVRLLAPLADDLKAWRKTHPASDDALIFPNSEGKGWSDGKRENWRKRKFDPAVEKAKVPIERPYDLRGAAASLWLYETGNALAVSRWLGHSMATLENHYAGIIDDLDPDAKVDASALILAARKATK